VIAALQLLADGLALGAAYALAALGFVLVLRAAGAVNFAHGDLAMAGGYAGVWLAGLLPVAGALVLMPLVGLVMAATGALVALVAVRPLRRAPPSAVFVATIAVGIMLQNAANGMFGAAERKTPPLAAGPALDLGGGVVVARQSLAIVAAAALLILALHAFLARTAAGRRLRAAAEDGEMARALGIAPVPALLASFALGGALAGIAGLLLANVHFVTPTAGLHFMLKAYIAATIGGWGSLRGAALGAVIVAAFEVAAARFVSPSVAEILLYALVFAILLLRPQGLFGEAAGRRA
jgi:branched-chain amino acid transport system permease protein